MQPATKFNDLLQRAQALGIQSGPPDEMEIRRIEREAVAMRRSGADIAGSWEVMAMCAAVRGDADAVMAAWTSGQVAPGRDEFTPLRFGDAFADVGDEQKARELAQRAAHATPKNPAVLAAAAQILGRCGFMHEATDLRMAAAELRGKSNGDDAALDELGAWEPEELTGPIVFARHFLARKKVKSHHATSWVSLGEDEEAPAFVYETFLELDAERTADLEAELFSELVSEDFPAERDGRVVITLSSWTKGSADVHNIE